MKTIPLNAQTFFKRAIAVAEHYGFHNANTAEVAHTCVRQETSSAFPEEHFDTQSLSDVCARHAEGNHLQKKHTLLFYTPSLVSHPSTPHTRVATLTLSAVGVHDPLSEVVVLKSMLSILEDIGIHHVSVRVNSIGDADSHVRFIREISNRLRQKAHLLPTEYSERMRLNMQGVIAELFEMRHDIITTMPTPLDFLTAPSRKHFKEVLELLEYAQVPFVLDQWLYGPHTMYSHTLYEIHELKQNMHTEEETSELLVRGGRYDSLTKNYTKTAVPAVGIVLALHTKEGAEGFPNPRPKKPHACLIHIGKEARLRSIGIVEAFRKQKIPIEQCLHVERFSEQIAYAETQKTKYIIIIGQREAHDGVVILRNVFDRSQKTVSIESLPSYFKHEVIEKAGGL